MSKLITAITLCLSINMVSAMESHNFIDKLETIEANLLDDLSGSSKNLQKLSKYKDQFSEEESYFYNLLDAHLLIMGSELDKGEALLKRLDKVSASPGREAMKYVLLAVIYLHRGENVDAFIATDKSLAILPSIKRSFYKTRVLTNAVGLYKDADLLEYALEHGRRAVVVANKLKDGAAICATSYELAAIELLAKNYKLAENRLLSTKSYCEKANYKIIGYAVDYSLLELKLETGKLTEARKIVESLHPKIMDYGWDVLISASQSMFARLLLEEGKPKEAKKYAMDAYKLAKKIEDKKRQEVAAGLIAKIYTEMDKHEEAVKYYKEYMEMNSENKTRIRQRKLAFDIARRGKL